ncbi:MAG: hypothetical protein O2968_22605, partial [Acidobacteria bacterium]|nr:hypothetical protein [Acidobacteriota bacterium]
ARLPGERSTLLNQGIFLNCVDSDRERIEINVNKILKFEVFDVRVQPGDVVYFPTSRGKQFVYRMADAAAFQVIWQGMGFLWR